MSASEAFDVLIVCATKSEAVAARSVQGEATERPRCGPALATVSPMDDYRCLTVASGLKASRLRQALDGALALGRPRLALNFGAAGGIGRDRRIGDITVPREIVSYVCPDLRADEKVVRCDIAALQDAKLPIVFTRAGTCPQDVRDDDLRSRIRSVLDIETTDWETYRLAELCEIRDLPFLAVRVVTDYADSRAGADYGRHADRVLRQAARILPDILKRMLPAS